MKYLLTTFTTIIAVGMFVTASPVLAQTPDGETPAEETVCDALQEDGVTKGLYGLCVAFCEAQDYADEYDLITPEELAMLEITTPSGRILANYNKKKDKANNILDPDMPCILAEASCPCWTADELASIDGILNSDGVTAIDCVFRDVAAFNFIREIAGGSAAQAATSSSLEACAFQDTLVVPRIFRTLSVFSGTLSLEQYEFCRDEVSLAILESSCRPF